MPLAAAPTPVPDAPMSDDEVWAWVQKVVPEEQQFEVLDRFADMNGTNQMHLFMAWRDVRRDGLQARRERARSLHRARDTARPQTQAGHRRRRIRREGVADSS